MDGPHSGHSPVDGGQKKARSSSGPRVLSPKHLAGRFGGPRDPPLEPGVTPQTSSEMGFGRAVRQFPRHSFTENAKASNGTFYDGMLNAEN
eukprot:1120160-Pyramimonas_sp.AAC.1